MASPTAANEPASRVEAFWAQHAAKCAFTAAFSSPLPCLDAVCALCAAFGPPCHAHAGRAAWRSNRPLRRAERTVPWRHLRIRRTTSMRCDAVLKASSVKRSCRRHPASAAGTGSALWPVE